MMVDLDGGADEMTADAVRSWLREQAIGILNVAGPRESTAPGIDDQAAGFLHLVLRPDAG